MTKRLAIAFFFDENHIVDDYMIYLMKHLKPYVDHTIFVSNGPISKVSELALKEVSEEVILRKNEGFDVWAYKAGLEHIGYDRLQEYDEVLLYNHTFYGPIFPFSEMFEEMEKRSDDFWGISSHGKLHPNPFTGSGVLPEHINSHFIAVRQPLLSSRIFRQYWETMDEINTYDESVLKHESRFTSYFSKYGYKWSTYVSLDDYDTPYPVFLNICNSLKNRNPILKRRLFFHDPLFLDHHAVDVPKAVDFIEKNTEYDTSLIWKNIVRAAEPRILNTNAALTKILPDYPVADKPAPDHVRIALCAHIYYEEMTNELLDAADNIPFTYDFIATTDTEEKKCVIENFAKQHHSVKNIIIRVVEENRGRDMSSLFITCRDLFLDNKYDLVLRLHTKKSPQVAVEHSSVFKQHLIENLAGSAPYTESILHHFQENNHLGLAFPPVIHFSYPTLGKAWFKNKAKVQDLCEELDIRVKIDEDTPVAPFGTMFWFRPQALRKLFEYEWQWSDFNKEPDHIDGGLAHALERLIGYVAMDAGYTVHHVMTPSQAAKNYGYLEYKYQKIVSLTPDHYTYYLAQVLKYWKLNNHPLDRYEYTNISIRGSIKMLIGSIKRSFQFRTGTLKSKVSIYKIPKVKKSRDITGTGIK
ncbi:rhamnan synthesis F family protein [Ochrobactrum quorumnocens]|uniref:rhamnan synthesis F family protein n=1 Tax=Ochrobactrum quorumnocens TaxID=271865 RepID=UPI00178317D2|nr:rhamnan synthesis F family protein [Ochrobactrum gallinarum]